MGKIIPGEYDTVAWTSRDREALRFVHATPCTQEQARELVFEIVQVWSLPLVTLTFTNKTGRTTRDRDHDNNVRISLPRDPLVPGAHPYGQLRVGLVLHELAHVVAPRRSHHGPDFVRALDSLIQYWFDKGKKTMSMDWDSYEGQILAYSNEISTLELKLEELRRTRARLMMEQARFCAPPVVMVESKGPKPLAPVLARCADCNAKTRDRAVRNGFEIALCLTCATMMELDAKVKARSSNGSGAEHIEERTNA